MAYSPKDRWYAFVRANISHGATDEHIKRFWPNPEAYTARGGDPRFEENFYTLFPKLKGLIQRADVSGAQAAVTAATPGQQARREIWGQTEGERTEQIREARRVESVGLRSAQLKLQEAEKSLAEFEGRDYVPSELAQIKERPIASFTPPARRRGGLRRSGRSRRLRRSMQRRDTALTTPIEERPIAMMRRPKTQGLTTPSGMPIRGELFRKPLTRQTILKTGPKDTTPLYAQPISGRR